MKNKTRILFPYWGNSVGGSHISSLELVQGLSNNEDFQPIVTIHQRGILAEYLSANSIPFNFAPNIKFTAFSSLLSQWVMMLTAAAPLSRFLKAERISIVHTNDRQMHLLWLIACRLAGCRLVWHLRTVTTSRRMGWYSQFVSRLITISQYCKSSFPANMRKRSVVIPNPVWSSYLGVNKDACRKALLDELDLPSETVLVGWCANWRAQKCPIAFVEIAPFLKKSLHRPIALLMFGEPREPIAELVHRRINEIDAANTVHVMGHRIPIEPYIAACDVLAATAVREGLGRTLIEAMMLQTPVVATSDGGHLEIIDDKVNGRLVPVGDARAMAEAIAEIVNDPETTSSLVEQALGKVRQKYATEAHVTAIVEIYKDLVVAT